MQQMERTFTVSVEDVNTGCINSDQVSVIVNPQDDPTFTTTDYCFGLANAATVTGTPSGTFAFNPAGGRWRNYRRWNWRK